MAKGGGKILTGFIKKTFKLATRYMAVLMLIYPTRNTRITSSPFVKLFKIYLTGSIHANVDFD